MIQRRLIRRGRIYAVGLTILILHDRIIRQRCRPLLTHLSLTIQLAICIVQMRLKRLAVDSLDLDDRRGILLVCVVYLDQFVSRLLLHSVDAVGFLGILDGCWDSRVLGGVAKRPHGWRMRARHVGH